MKNIDSFKIEQTCSLPRRAVSAGGAAFAGALAGRVAGAVADGAEEIFVANYLRVTLEQMKMFVFKHPRVQPTSDVK